MPIHIYNSLTRKKDEFKPLDPSLIKMYVCGPTVYDQPHIGHARSAYIFSVIKNYLEYKKYKVKFVRNVTDVDDKIIDKAKKEFKDEDLNIAVKKVSEKYLAEYHSALEELGIASEGILEPKASEYIPQMVKFIEELIKRGAAYSASGDVYFDITKAKDYGKLSNQSLGKMESGVRISPSEKKNNPLDFALWKSAKEGEPSWESPWGAGRPGWHIECSVMSSDLLGDEFDIHGGGIDLIFPHHENEIAQSEGLGKKFARYWIHHGLLTINSQKMAKSLGNFVTIKDALKNINAQENAKADILKDFFLQAHYSVPIDFSIKSIQESTEAIVRILELLAKDFDIKKPSEEDKEINFQISQFENAMNDDFNTARARCAIFGIMRRCNSLFGVDGNPSQEERNAIQYGRNTIRRLGSVLGLSLPKYDPQDPKWGDISVENVYKDVKYINDKIDERKELKKQKQYIEADKVRKELEEKGIILKDSKDGSTEWEWKR